MVILSQLYLDDLILIKNHVKEIKLITAIKHFMIDVIFKMRDFW